MELLQKLQNKKDKRNQNPTALIKPLAPGTAAPDFVLHSTTGDSVQLSSRRGHPVILAFYPADNSPVCSNQLALYNEALPIFGQYNADLFGLSIDDPASHASFARNLNLSFSLLADHDPLGAITKTYGVFDENKNNAGRALFVIDSQGIIRWSYLSPTNINPGANGILAALDKL
jgi:peroxiredoxin